MDESTHRNKPDPEPPTPEVDQLLKLLEVQAAARRGERPAPLSIPFQGVSFRYGSLVVIILFCLGSVAAMEWMVSQLPRPVHTLPPAVLAAKSGSGSPIMGGQAVSNH